MLWGAFVAPNTSRMSNTLAANKAWHASKMKSLPGSKQAEVFNIKGFVRDASGQPLPGVSVTIKGTKTGTQTDANGKFAISANAGDVLEFSFIGYFKKE